MNALGQAKSWRNSLLSNSDRGSELDSRERHRCESAGHFETLESIASGSPADPVARISEPAYDLIVQTESGGKAYYQRILKARPHWPGFSSGITIGFGFDLGQKSKSVFEATWKGHLPEGHIARLARAIGFHTSSSSPAVRQEQIRRAKRLVSEYSDIRIPWGVASNVFAESMLPRWIAITLRHLPQAEALSPLSFGALVSLTFNRGPSYSSPGSRYREMREIKAALASGQEHLVPDLIRSMKRLWPTSEGLQQRRDDEANLFLEGLDGIDRHIISVFAGESVQTETVESDAAEASPLEEDWYEHEENWPGDISFSADETAVLESLGAESHAVHWPSNDDHSPDYRHLDPGFAGARFTLVPADLELLIAANRFQPHFTDEGTCIFALRGAQLVGAGSVEKEDRIVLRDVRPDHRTYRCVIGLYSREAKRLYAYTASTVPNTYGVQLCYKRSQQGLQLAGNLLPTGCYAYKVGTHKGKAGKLKHALLQIDPSRPKKRAAVTVLRSINDLAYGSQDMWHRCVPHDNLHPGQRTNGFSSIGCLTVRGRYSVADDAHLGEWGMFRTAGRFKDNMRYDVVLLTGLDAAIASRMREEGVAADDATVLEQLVCLRHGSEGREVKALQKNLGITADGKFGAGTKDALARYQSEVLGYADGLYHREMDGLFGWQVLGPSTA